MLTIITCTQCHHSGGFEIEYVFHAREPSCRECMQDRYPGWKMYFCNLKCFAAWWDTNKVEKRGVPCQECRNPMEGPGPTGHQFGIKENGSCAFCKGDKAVKRQLKGDPIADWAAERNKGGANVGGKS
jgi:hypothetical protein